MKNTKISFRLILAALAATAALASCTKEITPGQTDKELVSPRSEGSRVIAVSFGNATKTGFSITDDGIAPFFEEGDDIVLCSDTDNPTDENTQTCTVFIDENTKAATITTKLTGELTAYYPASLVSKSEKHGLYIYVPSAQDGTFANANICSATIAENATSATFNNIYALFVVNTPSEGIKKLTIKSLRPIGDDGQRSGEERIICGTGDDNCKITVGDGTEAIPSPCYVALIHGVNLSDLSFEATSNVEGATGYIKGIPTSAIANAAGGAVGSEEYVGMNSILRGTSYTIDGNNWHEYVTIAGRKWAKMNLKTSVTTGNYDDYYMWGTTVMAYSDIEASPCSLAVMKEMNPYGDEDYPRSWDANNGFSWYNCPFTYNVFSEINTNAFTKYVPIDQAAKYGDSCFYDDKTRLDLSDDAAHVHWGGAWRIPTKEELSSAQSTLQPSLSGTLNATATESKVEIYDYEAKGYYWSSTLDEANPSKAYCWVFNPGEDGSCQEIDRFYGCTIRAIVDEPAEEPQEDASQD